MVEKGNDREQMLDSELRKRIEALELVRALSEVERKEQEGKDIPSLAVPIFRRVWRPLEYLGGILLGVNIAVGAIVFNFLLFNYLLHMTF